MKMDEDEYVNAALAAVYRQLAVRMEANVSGSEARTEFQRSGIADANRIAAKLFTLKSTASGAKVRASAHQRFVDLAPTFEETEILMMLGGPYANDEYFAEQLPRLRANRLSEGVYGFGDYPMAKIPV